ALWFWPLDKVPELDGTAPEYTRYADGRGVVTGAELPDLLGWRTGEAAPAASSAEAEPAVAEGPAPGDQVWEAAGLFDDPNGEQGTLAADSGSSAGRVRGRKAQIRADPWRGCIPLANLADWLDFLECLLGTKDMPEGLT